MIFWPKTTKNNQKKSKIFRKNFFDRNRFGMVHNVFQNENIKFENFCPIEKNFSET